MKKTVMTLQKQKQQGNKISMLTAYDYTTAKLMDEAGIDILLVGDSLGMVMLGYEDTLQVTMADMIHHSRGVARGAKEALVVTDLPFLSYHVSVAEAVLNAGRLVKEGLAEAVKLEGGVEFAEVIRGITHAQIPVVAHLGLTPQSVNAFGGFKIQGKSLTAAEKLVKDARAVEAAGAVAIVLEGIPAPLAAYITKQVQIPTIGIGAGPDTDGQVLVYQDMLGMFDELQPKFVKRFAEVGQLYREAFSKYQEEIQQGLFPTPAHSYTIDSEIMTVLKAKEGESFAATE